MTTADGTVLGATKIVDHGAGRWNLVLIAEGYQRAELAQFANDAQNFVDALFATAPLDELRCAINVYRIDVASTDSGADDPTACGGTGATPATYFDASFCNGGIRRLLLVNAATAQSVATAQVPDWHQILVIVNSSIWGGAGGTIATTSTAPGWEAVAIHELGHSTFGLADEYEYWAGCGIDTTQDTYTGPEPAEPNVTTDTDRATLKWGDLVLATTPLPTTSHADCTQCDPQPNPLLAGTVGAFEGARYYHCGLYRPEFNCMMRNLSGFCAVCRRRIRETLKPYLPKCLAPVFKGSSWWACLFKVIGYLLAVLALLVFAWIPGILCLIKQLLFRARHCRSGNADPCIPL